MTGEGMWVNSGQEIREEGGGTVYKGNSLSYGNPVGRRSLYPELLNYSIKARDKVEIMTHEQEQPNICAMSVVSTNSRFKQC